MVAEVGSIESPAACPKCGSMDLYRAYFGRRTKLWLSSCRDCRETIRSREYFTVAERQRPSVELTNPKTPYEPRPDDAMVSANDVRMAVMRKLNITPERSREPGEEG